MGNKGGISVAILTFLSIVFGAWFLLVDVAKTYIFETDVAIVEIEENTTDDMAIIDCSPAEMYLFEFACEDAFIYMGDKAETKARVIPNIGSVQGYTVSSEEKSTLIDMLSSCYMFDIWEECMCAYDIVIDMSDGMQANYIAINSEDGQGYYTVEEDNQIITYQFTLKDENVNYIIGLYEKTLQ